MIRVLFLIHDLEGGGAEKVLVNLANHLDRTLFHVTVVALFGGGVNEKNLNASIRYKSIYPFMIPANSRWMKAFSPSRLHDEYVKEKYDIEVSFLEGPSARVISGCPEKAAKTVCWLHQTFHSRADLSFPFRSYKEAVRCYDRFHTLVFVSRDARDSFLEVCPVDPEKCIVLYNTNDTDRILAMAGQEPEDISFSRAHVNWCGVGKLEDNKKFDRMIRIQKQLIQSGLPAHLYILGEGSLRKKLESLSDSLGISDSVTFLGYRENPYQYMAQCDLFVCSSYSEGFSTAATEALILGLPVCTVEVSGMRELLGQEAEYGIITPNKEEALCKSVKELVSSPALLDYYRKKARERSGRFNIESTVKAVEDIFLEIAGKGGRIGTERL